jgi:RHS repeat-associated protein
VVVTDYLLGSQGIEAKIDETAQTEAYYKIDPTTGIRLFDANNNLIVAYRGVTSWYIYDGHGNVVGTVNGVTGAFAANPTLDIYGVPRATGTSATKQGYCGSLGHVTDDTGLVYMRARYYDPNVGRFVSEDPGANGNNWYVYAGDNPVTNADQDGKKSTLGTYILGINQYTMADATALALIAMFLAYASKFEAVPATRNAGMVVAVGIACLAVMGLAIALGESSAGAIVGAFSGAITCLVGAVMRATSDGMEALGGFVGEAGVGVMAAVGAYSLALIAACTLDDN